MCSKCGEITYINPKVVAGLIPIMPNGNIVLLKRSIEPALGRWTFPAGYMEMKETIEQAAVRETLEEINAKVKLRTSLRFKE